MSDVNFINSYNEIVFDNFIAILKQNLMFQTQLKIIEPKLARITELEQQLTESGTARQEVERLQATVQSLTAELTGKNAQIQQHSGSDAERHRIQSALNEKMRECESLKSSVEVLNRELQVTSGQASRAQEVSHENESLRTRTTKLEETVHTQADYIKKLEDMLPISKRKKLGLPVQESAINTTDALMSVESSGGIF